MAIKLFDEQRKIKLDVHKIRGYLLHIEKKMSRKAGSKNDNYSIVFTDDEHIKKLNKRFRNTNRPTDVLSFSSCGQASPYVMPTNHDIFISVETAKDNAKFYKQDFYREILRLIIHGILHSSGFTDYTQRNKKIMWDKQESILKCILLAK